jgi:hypothetical protein
MSALDLVWSGAWKMEGWSVTPWRRGVITLVTAPGDGEVTVVSDESMGEKDPLLAKLLAAATAGAPPAGPANKRKPVRIVLDPDDHARATCVRKATDSTCTPARRSPQTTSKAD